MLRQKQNFIIGDRSNKLYNTSLADELFREIKILCLILTQPKSHKTKAKHVKNTWGKKCNKLVFLTTQDDTELDATALSIEEKYENLWGKVKLGFELAYKKYYDEYDWILKVECIRHSRPMSRWLESSKGQK